MTPFPDYMPALITPFTQRGDLDVKAHNSNMATLAEKGIAGFVIGGSNGEGPYLETGERAKLVKAGRRRKAHFMVGIVAETTRQALVQVDEATDARADSVLLLNPTTLVRYQDEAIYRYFKTLADHASVPVFIYSVPRVTAYSMPLDLVSRISRHPNVVGMKDSSGDVVRLQSIIDATPRDFILYSGSSKALTGAIAIGCHGAITGSGNYATALVLQTLAKAKQNPIEAQRLQKRLSKLSGDVEAHGIPGVKAAAKAAGLEPGFPRQPLQRLSRGAETSIAKLIS